MDTMLAEGEIPAMINPYIPRPIVSGDERVTRLFPDYKEVEREYFRQTGIFPIMHVTADDPPFLLIHGERDTLVPYEQSQLMYDRLVQTNVPAQLVIVKNTGHSFVSADGPATPTLGEINQIILNFLAEHLH